MDYKNGKVYRVICEETNRQYIGSTCTELRKRLHQHKRKGNTCMTKDFINASIILIEDYPCERKEQLLMRERHFIETMECVNKYRPIVSREETLEKQKEYHEINKDKRNEYSKQYNEKNKERLNKYNKQYNEKNKEKIKEKNKEYRQKNKDEINRKRRENKEKIKEYSKEYRKKNSEYQKEYYKKNKEKIKEHNKAYKQKNRDEINRKQREKRAAAKLNK
jgi:hypothetical protein